ncbi:unnamed protein product [Ilex paraguariensis]|uniref:Uncharacterized protein n=1 Tax=Ilex paraguariensis TaxID=185542 RepID=A0ABC8SN93_9AQUA
MRVGEEPINIHGDGMIDIEVGGQELAGVVVIEGGVRHHGSEGEPEGSKVNVGPILVGCPSCEEERKLHGRDPVDVVDCGAPRGGGGTMGRRQGLYAMGSVHWQTGKGADGEVPGSSGVADEASWLLGVAGEAPWVLRDGDFAAWMQVMEPASSLARYWAWPGTHTSGVAQLWAWPDECASGSVKAWV